MDHGSAFEGSNSVTTNGATEIPRDAWDYWIDAWQRWVLLLDVLQKRSERYAEHLAKTAPHVLKFPLSVVMDGRELARPVNYLLIRIDPVKATEVDPRKRPFVIVDPRAGHGPGIGGFKAESEIGVASQGGPPLLLHRLPARARAWSDHRGHRARGGSVSRARDRAASGSRRQACGHRQLPGRLGRHDGGSQAARAFRPDHRCRLAAVLLGRRARRESYALHRRPARWQLADGADGRPRQRQVRRRLARQQFREPQPRQHATGPSTTISIPRSTPKAPRYLEFEQWWGGHVLLNAEEMQFIADELFIGNKLATARDRVVGRHARRPAQHPFADRRVLLEGRQHHAAATGA